MNALVNAPPAQSAEAFRAWEEDMRAGGRRIGDGASMGPVRAVPKLPDYLF